jgi:protein-S-isoprenylcysteine O-methyltransferase Ste14
MRSLELKVPPPIVALVVALLMWAVAAATPALGWSAASRISGAVALLLAGFAVRAAAQLALLRARTTINPINPSNTSALVSGGIYRFTRNPMYLGRLLQLAGWAVFLSNVLATVLLPAYVLYITRFQIQPEERALLERFGEEYAAYQQGVRRWL